MASFGGIFHDFLDGPWEEARGFLREELEQLYLALKSQQATTFDTNSTLLSQAIQGVPTSPTRYVANTGPANAPTWDQINLSNGVSSRLPFTHLAQALASTLLGRRSTGNGNYESISLGSGLAMSAGGVLSASGSGGTVTHTGALVANQLVIGNGTADEKPLGSLGTTTTLLHGNAAGAPTFAAVSLTADVSGDLPFANLVPATAGSKLVGRRSGSSGDFEELAPGNSVAITSTTLDTIQDIRTTATPQFTRIGLGAAADASAVATLAGQYYSPLVNDGNSGTADTIDWNAGNVHFSTLTGNVTYTLSNPKDGAHYTIIIATGAGSFTVTWPAAVLWPGGTPPTITITAAKVDVIHLDYVASTGKYYGTFQQAY